MTISQLKLKGITARLSALSWLITILTLTIFASAIIPEQKRDLLEALRSKALGISSSLQEVTATAAISEDYSSVVDQCVQALAGDSAIDYLVITRNDGFSVIVEKRGWRTDVLDKSWRPADRRPFSFIGNSMLAGQNVFSFGKPVDYSGIRWGWIHVGLSLKAYDQSVTRVYQRTGLLAILCVGLGLLASVWYARRMVRPIVSLQKVVQRVAAGDLTVRSDIRSQDELGSLGESFNRMTHSILQRNLVLESIRFAAQEFLTAAEWRSVVPGILEKTARAAGVSRAFIFQNQFDVNGALQCLDSFEWDSEGILSTSAAEGGTELPWHRRVPEAVAEQLSRSLVVNLSTEALQCHERDHAEPSVKSRILMPVQVGQAWWGILGFDDCERERVWSEAERDTFQAVAGMLGATIARQQVRSELVKANETLEARVTERTRELQEQVDAKERARAELALAQHRLIEVSRQAGMAEVATNVLHNVGNVLNSLNTSAGVVAGIVHESRVNNVVALVNILQEHNGNLDAFLSTDLKGQIILPYLTKVSSHMQQERERMLKELTELTDHIGHIKSIVTTQQRYAAVSGLIEELSISELVEDACRIVEAGFARHHVEIAKDFESVPPVSADKHLVLQILLNLLRNAKQATAESGKPERAIRLQIHRHGENRIRIVVKDNGVGLPPENLTRIFAHGFTTKIDGHGFGLHSSALAARQMGGSLWAESEGLGQGATFTLELPLTNKVSAEAPR